MKSASNNGTSVLWHACSICGAREEETVYASGSIRNGDRGDRVKRLQELLNKRGYNCGKGQTASLAKIPKRP